jgi:hypothetical protein
LSIQFPNAKVSGNVITASVSDVTIYLRLPQFDVVTAKMSAEDSGNVVDTFAGTDEMSAPTSR